MLLFCVVSDTDNVAWKDHGRGKKKEGQNRCEETAEEKQGGKKKEMDQVKEKRRVETENDGEVIKKQL